MAEGFHQLTRTGTPTSVWELLGGGIDLAANGNSEKTARSKPIDHGAIESDVPEQVTEHEVHRFAIGEPGIQIEDIEAASVRQPGKLGQLPSQVDRNRGHVHAPVRQPPARKPHSTPSTPTRDLQRLASRWKEMVDVGEHRKRRRHPEDRRHAPGAVPAIPMLATSLVHGSKTIRRRGPTWSCSCQPFRRQRRVDERRGELLMARGASDGCLLRAETVSLRAPSCMPSRGGDSHRLVPSTG